MKKTLLKSSLKYLLFHPWQIFLSILGIALGVAVVISIDLANQSARHAFKHSLETVAGKATHHIIGSPAGIPDSIYRNIRIDYKFRNSAPVIEGYIVVESDPVRTFTLLGVDPFAEKPFRHFLNYSGEIGFKSLYHFLTKPNAVFISDFTAKALNVQIGDTLFSKIGVALNELVIAGVITTNDKRSDKVLENLMIADISTAQELLQMKNRISRIDLIVGKKNYNTELERIKSILPPGVRIERSGSRSQTAEQMVKAFNMNLTAMSLLALVVGMFLIYNTMTFSVVQRRVFLGLLRSLGVTRREIFFLIINEAILLGIIGTILGSIMGIILAKGMVQLVTQSINDLYFVLNVRSLQISTIYLIKGIILGVGATFFAAIKPAREATTAPPRVVMSRSIVETELKRNIPKLTIFGVVIAFIGSIILFTPSKSIWLSYSGLVPLVLGLSLLTPLCIFGLVRFFNPIIGRSFGILGKMASRGVLTQISRTSVAIAALSIAVATTIGVGTMVTSFRNTVQNWLGNLLSADIFISAPRLIATQSRGNLNPILVSKIAQKEEVQHVNYYRENVIHAEQGAFILLTAKVGEHRYNDFIFKSGNSGKAWEAYQNREAALITETYAYRYNKKVGDKIFFLTDRGEKEFKIEGIYYDYSTDLGKVSIAHHTYLKYWDDNKLSGILVYAHDGTNINDLMNKIRTMDGENEKIQVQSNKSLFATSINIFDRTFLITNVLQMLAIIVAFIGVLSALMAIQLERSREFGVLRANGLTPRQLWKMVLMQTGLMGLISGIISIPIGNILALVLIKVINERSFGWTLRFDFRFDLLVQAILLAVFAALLAGIYPAYKMAKTSPALALREE